MLDTDVDWFYELRSNSEFMKYMDRPLMDDRQQSIDHLNNIRERIETNTGIQWIIEDIETGKPIGYAGFWRYDEKNNTGELGYGLNPENTGSGLMTEAVELCLEYGFNTLGLERAEAWINSENDKSGTVLERAGFKREGHLKNVTYFNGKYLDLIVYALLSAEWKSENPR